MDLENNSPPSNEQTDPDTDRDTDLAPTLGVPLRAISVVEHPCIIKNVDKGIVSLGGATRLSKTLRAKPNPTTEDDDGVAPDLNLPEYISASLRPDDPSAKRLLSAPVRTNNLLLKVTVPRRTGRKRKRGSTAPFLDANDATNSAAPASPYVPAPIIFRSIQDNASKYTVTPVGVIDESHRFRTLPDIQYAASDDPTMKNITEKLLPLRYSQIKNFDFDRSTGMNPARNVGVTAEFLQMPVAYSYKFQQNPNVKYTGDAREEINVQKRLAADGYHFIEPTAETVPTGPKSNNPPEHTVSPLVQTLITSIRQQLARRPIITRHLLFNILGWDKRDRIREAAVYCGYFFASGPWREALVAWGLDPRTDPIYRQYQTISFVSFLKAGTSRHRLNHDKHLRELAKMPAERLSTEHIFDGINVSNTGNLFQFCDITDPLIRKILDTEDIRDTCAPTFPGWYHIGTWAKATVIMKDKMNSILGGRTPDNTLYERIISWPEIWDDQEIAKSYRHEAYDKAIRKEKLREHTIMMSVRVAARNPRYAFEKMEEQENQERVSEERGEEEYADVDAEGEMDIEEEAEEVQVPEDLTEAPDTADVILHEGEDESEDDDDIDEGDFDEDAEGEDEDAEGEEEIFYPVDPEDDIMEDVQAPATQSRAFGGLYPTG